MTTTLSVITISFNNLNELIATCESVDNQTIKPTEHLIIDGSHNDEIVNWLIQNPQPLYRRWIHERDEGISDAFNKGITNARYELTHLLNSGDKYATNIAIETMLAAFNEDPDLMWTHSLYIQHRGDIDVVTGAAFDKNKLWKGMRTVAHQSMFVKKDVYERHGLFNKEYKVAMDYDLLVRIRNEKYVFISSPLIYFSPGGVSSQQYKKGLKEVKRIYQSHMGYSIKQTLWQLRQQLLHRFMETGLGKMWFRWKNKV